MVGETDSEQIEGLTLIPVGAAPHARNRFDLVVLAEPALQADSLVLRYGMQEVDDLEARIGGIPVDGGDAAEAVELLLMLALLAKRLHNQ